MDDILMMFPLKSSESMSDFFVRAYHGQPQIGPRCLTVVHELAGSVLHSLLVCAGHLHCWRFKPGHIAAPRCVSWSPWNRSEDSRHLCLGHAPHSWGSGPRVKRRHKLPRRSRYTVISDLLRFSLVNFCGFHGLDNFPRVWSGITDFLLLTQSITS